MSLQDFIVHYIPNFNSIKDLDLVQIWSLNYEKKKKTEGNTISLKFPFVLWFLVPKKVLKQSTKTSWQRHCCVHELKKRIAFFKVFF